MKRIALELLALYESAARDQIWECSASINGDMARLDESIAEFKREIEEATE
ncbi:hypothetical protein J2T13_000217 [Paenibacillus sp. DS2015]|uniref:hypothetical protein n=1 Tax=Paenibacillus sp. DS2015 TaxID=3373917 RepID=UPI003D203615